MQKKILLLVFGIAVIGELYGVLKKDEVIECTFKPFIIISLLMMYLSSVKKVNQLYVLILVLSLLSDFLIIYRFDDFLVSIAFFLATVINFFYIILLKSSFKKVEWKQFFLVLIPVLIVALIIFISMSNFLGVHYYLILAYTFMDATLLSVSFHNFLIRPSKGNLWFFLGIFTLIIADSFFAVYRFSDPDVVLMFATMFLYAVFRFLVCKAMILKGEKQWYN